MCQTLSIASDSTTDTVTPHYYLILRLLLSLLLLLLKLLHYHSYPCTQFLFYSLPHHQQMCPHFNFLQATLWNCRLSYKATSQSHELKYKFVSFQSGTPHRFAVYWFSFLTVWPGIKNLRMIFNEKHGSKYGQKTKMVLHTVLCNW